MRNLTPENLTEKVKIIEHFLAETKKALKSNQLEEAKHCLKSVELTAYIPTYAQNTEARLYIDEILTDEQAQLGVHFVEHFFNAAKVYLHNGNLRGVTHSLQAIINGLPTQISQNRGLE
ncbi:hypothetical protein [Avibacterium avium]|uniref:hypothetical protein n=1 Tax=Avibacterium avium TaxID=751 RepID=UPI003BF8B3EE